MVKKKKNSRSLLEPRILLDAEVLEAINTYYSSYLGEKFIGLECFSHPSMDNHVCNIFAKSEGGDTCPHCSNIPGRRCLITCNIHRFCLGG